MAVEEFSPPRRAGRARPTLWYRSWRVHLAVFVAILAYAYGWRVTQIRMAELWRGAYLLRPFIGALASPDVVAREQHVQRGTALFYYGGERPAAAPGEGPRLALSQVTGAIGDGVTATGQGFAPNRRGVLWWENQIGQRQQLGSFTTDAQGRFSLAFTAPEVQGTHNMVIAEVLIGEGPLRPSQTLLVVLDRMVETVFLALMGTTMGVVFAVPLSFLGAKNLTASLPAGGVVYGVTRTFFNLMRSIEALVLAIIFTVWVGLRPFAGLVALRAHSIASLGKLYSEANESIEAW